MENLFNAFRDVLKRLQVSKNDRLLLAVSGGLDSVVLTDLIARAGLDFDIAHVNFQLRGAESNRDEDFVQALAEKYGSGFFIKRFHTADIAETDKLSIQVTARNLRYDWFKTLMKNESPTYRFLVTAHHQDDNIETMLMHFFRGTGIEGLSGMPEKTEILIRPLLTFSKKLLQEFADAQNLKWVEDSSNATSEYTRNFFRNELQPAISRVFPGLHQILQNNLQRFSEAATVYRQAIAGYKKKLLNPAGTEMHIPIGLLKKSIPLRTILFEILKDYQFSPGQTDDVIRLMDGANGNYISSASNRIIKNRRWLIIAPLEEMTVSHFVIDRNETAVDYAEGKLQLKYFSGKDSETFSKDSTDAYLDADKIQFPLVLRKWKTGDYFYPLGMKKKKKLARFFIDQKLSRTAKEKVWVLIMDNQIIWVVGYRIDNRFSIRDSTCNRLMIKNVDA